MQAFINRDSHDGHTENYTPLQAVDITIYGKRQRVYLKLEGANPTGSVKYRTAMGLLQSLAEESKLTTDSVIIESTSGNLGVALAYLCQQQGYPFIAVIDPKTTEENIAKMLRFGAQLELVEEPDESGGYLLSRLERVRKLCDMHPQYVWTNQYMNPANPRIHAITTAPEIYQQMDRQVDALFVAVSTGGTLAGIGDYFAAVSPETRIIAVDAYGSVIFDTVSAPRKLTGIGASRRSYFIQSHHYSQYRLVSDEEAFATCRLFAREADIFLGGSSGAVLFACASYLAAAAELEHVVCLCPDGGENYLNTIYNDEWIQQNGLDLNNKPGALLTQPRCVPSCLAVDPGKGVVRSRE